MTVVVLNTPSMQKALGALPERFQGQIKVRPHPSLGGPRMLTLTSRTWEADAMVLQLTKEFGSCTWLRGRWHVKRAQLSLFREGTA